MSERRMAVNGTATVTEMDIHYWREKLLDFSLRVLLFASPLVLLFGILYAIQRGLVSVIVMDLVAFGLLLGAYFWKRGPYWFRAGVLLVIVFALSLLFFSVTGLSGDGRIFLIALPFASLIFFGRRGGGVALGGMVLTLTVFGVLFSTGTLTIPPERLVTTGKAGAWISNSLTLLFITVFLMGSQDFLQRRLYNAFVKSRELTSDLEAERMAAEKNAEVVQRQADRIARAAMLGNAIAAMRHQDELIHYLVTELANAFRLYQVNVFLLDPQRNVLTLAAGSSSEGKRLARENWQVLIGGRTLPGMAAQRRIEQMSIFEPGDLVEFPFTRIELSMPLIARGELIGVLDIHGKGQPFSDADVQLFRIVAGYAATTLDMLNLLEVSEVRRHEMEALYTRQTSSSWGTFLEAEHVHHYQVGGESAPSSLARLGEQSMHQQVPQSRVLEGGDGYLLVIPLVARGVPLGYLGFSRAFEKGPWSEETQTLLETAVERLALALDNTRLLMETRSQAFYEEQLSRISETIWRNSSVETMMEQGVRELGMLLGASEVTLQLTNPSDGSEEAGS